MRPRKDGSNDRVGGRSAEASSAAAPRSGRALLHPLAAALGREQILGGFFLGGLRALDRRDGPGGARLAARAEVAGEVPVRGADASKDFAGEVGVEVGVRADEVAAKQVD